MLENIKRNESLYAYHLKHPQTGCTKLGRIFSHRNKEGKQVPLSPSAVWRIIKHVRERKEKEHTDLTTQLKDYEESTK